MDLHTWLDDDKGRAAWLAEQLGRSKTAVSLWRGQGVPMPLIPAIVDLTAGAVTDHEMLQHALRCRTAAPQATTEQATT